MKYRITNLGDVEIKEVGVQNRLNNSGNDRDDIIEACKINNMHFYSFDIEINMKQEEKYNFVCLLYGPLYVDVSLGIYIPPCSC